MVYYKHVLDTATGRPLLDEATGRPRIYDADLYPDGPPDDCCCVGCCPTESLPETLGGAVTGNGECACYTSTPAFHKQTPGANQAWLYRSDNIDINGPCGTGLDVAIDVFCISTTHTTAEGWLLEEGKTYAKIYSGGGGCMATDPVDPLSADTLKPVEVTVLSCDPFHLAGNLPMSDYRPNNNDCNCDGSVDIELTAPA